ncbi:hypothetical protein RJ640_008528 [Escallonia rubra]|uniref:Protein kinase domain-containing protein n=1 Tax=Escallonia rubra TaxID=112253 RepID=A0AA88UQC1_9ASTE|nr:hypothetical protein RJ640_008528 [Escallonia rubra]
MDMLKNLLLIIACLLGFVHAIDDNPGFTSIDCGLPIGSDYTDARTEIDYTSDAGVVDTGVPSPILPEFKDSSLARQFWTLRSFPQEKRNCYNLKPAGGKGTQYLIRASFMYGNYDAKSLPPTFDLYLGVGFWDTVVIDDPSSFKMYEIIHILPSDDINLCLINTNKGIPFISALELRSLSSNLYTTESGSLALFRRRNFGSSTNELVRFQDDAYDRIWSPVNVDNSTISSISTLSDIDILDNQLPPSIVMKTAITPIDATGLSISWDPYNSTVQYYFYFYFAEVEVLQPNQRREFNIYLNGLLFYGPYSPDYLTAFGAVSDSPLSASQCGDSDSGNYSCEILIKQTERSTLPPFINALEIYTVKKFLDTETDENDVGAIMSIKSVYGVTRNWQGDPCAPKAYAWDGLNCSYNGYSSPPRIISLNLSSSGLSGVIAPYISNLTLLESLDLSYNSLRGDVPEFLTQLASLRILYLKGNNFTGSIPAQLLEKQGKGLLLLSIDGPANSTPYPSPPVKKKKNLIVPIVASSAGAAVLVLLTASLVILWLIKQRKRQVARKVETVSLGKGGNLDDRKRLFKYSEVQRLTNNFQRTVGKGGFGSLYYGHVDGIGPVAVKMLSPESAQGHNEFKAEAKLLLTVHHKNLTSLVGYCNEATHKGIIYEYMANGDLNKHLSGLDYLHHGCKPPMIHRDVKTTNILLTENFQAKLADFGLSRKCPIEGDTQPSTAVAGTLGYLDPEYRSYGRLTAKSDVYSFGVVLLVIITGRPAIANGTTHITQWVSSMLQKGDVTYIVDPKLKGDFDVISVQKAVALARACVVGPSTTRPTMNHVVTELKECLAAEADYRDTECKDSIRQSSMILESDMDPRAR